jgi:hypothetical protein
MHLEDRYGFSVVFDWQTTETCVLPDRHPRRADFFIRMGSIGWMMSDRERKGLAIIETAAPDVYAGARQSSPPHCQKFPRPMGRGILPSGFLGALRIGRRERLWEGLIFGHLSRCLKRSCGNSDTGTAE